MEPGILTETDFTPDLCRALVAEHGDIEKAARAVVHRCYSERYNRPVAWRTVRAWISQCIGPRRLAGGMELAEPADPERLNQVAEMFESANLPLDSAVGRITRTKLGKWEFAAKDEATQEIITKTLRRAEVTIDPAPPEFPVIQPAPTTSVLFVEPPRILRKTRTEVIVSDIQAGFLRDMRTDTLEPIHDPDALDIAYQITADAAPDRIIFVGDVADLAPFSRWAQHPEYRGTLQASVDVVHEILGTFVSAAGVQCKSRVMIGSNHDHRIEKGVLEWNKEALRVRRAGNVDGWPVFSLGYLARFDDLGLDWSGQYPGGEFYILDDLVVMHAPPKAKEFAGSVIHGHTHKVEMRPGIQHARDGRKTRFVYDVGCLCQVGVTDDKMRLLVTRVPSDRGRTDWNQGVGVVHIVESTGSRAASHAVDLAHIVDGRAIFGGRVYDSRRDDATDEAA